MYVFLEKPDKIVRRKEAKKGDLIFVTGPFGYTSAGLKLILSKEQRKNTLTRKLIKSFLKPKPKLKFGLKSKKYFSSAMDSSDGLSTTLNELAKQSKKKFIINRIPAKKDLQLFAKSQKLNLN